jgi:hypothetical protein
VQESGRICDAMPMRLADISKPGQGGAQHFFDCTQDKAAPLREMSQFCMCQALDVPFGDVAFADGAQAADGNAAVNENGLASDIAAGL